MDRLNLNAEERSVLGKKVNRLRKEGKLPGHVFGKGLDSEHVTVDGNFFLHVFHQAGETGLIDLKIGKEKIRPVMVREVQYDPITGNPIHIDFYQVNLTKKVKVAIPLTLIGDEPESVKLGETIVLQTLNEIEVEALPTDLVEKIEVDITPLKAIDDAITVSELNYDRSKLTIHADGEAVIVKLAPAVSAETEALLAEQAAEQAAVSAETKEGAQKVEGVEGEVAEGEVEAEGGEVKEGAEGQVPAEGEKVSKSQSTEEKQA